MFDNLLIHPRTLKQLEQFITKPSHGLILVGPKGSGKKTLANYVASDILKISTDKLASYPYFSLTNPDDPTITIDEIRALQGLLTLKIPSKNEAGIKRVLTVIDAGRMRFEAQNAFLKSLEEPPTDTCIILTAEANGDLLETIYSRVQRIDVMPVSESMARSYYSKKGLSELEITKNYALSQGQVGLLASLLTSESNHILRGKVELAKNLLSIPPGERILQTDILSKDKVELGLLINAFGRISSAALNNAAKSGNETAYERWKNSLTVVQRANKAMSHNANAKLLLDNLLLSI